MLAHRFSHAAYKGTVPSGMNVLHSCDNKWCVNPDHLRLGTQADNVADMVSKGREASGEKSGQSKLSLEEVVQIRKLFVPGSLEFGFTALGRTFGVTFSAIQKIIINENWKGVGPDKDWKPPTMWIEATVIATGEVEIYPSLKAASIHVGCTPSFIGHVLAGKRKRCKGRTWAKVISPGKETSAVRVIQLPRR